MKTIKILLTILTISALAGCAAETETDDTQEAAQEPAVTTTQKANLTSIDPDIIDVAAEAAARAPTKPKGLVTYGPVITIKPKG